MTIRPNICKWCNSTYHFSFQCPKNPKAQKPSKQRKSIKKIGKVTKKWLEVRKAFLDKQTEFRCFYCGLPLERNKVEVDHYKPRGSHPELRYELSNLVACCWSCNGKKGSTDGDIFVKEERWKPN